MPEISDLPAGVFQAGDILFFVRPATTPDQAAAPLKVVLTAAQAAFLNAGATDGTGGGSSGTSPPANTFNGLDGTPYPTPDGSFLTTG